MKPLIFGSNGQAGTALQACAPEGVNCVPVTRTDGDLTDSDTITRIVDQHQPTHIINAAAYTAVDAAESDEASAQAINVFAPAAMARAARSCDARFLHISTDFVFDGTSGRPYRPGDATNPLGVYGRTKRDGETAVLKEDPTALIVRTSWIYGSAHKNFAKTMLALAQQRDTLSVVADQIGTPTSASSLAEVLWLLATKDAGGILHYSDSGVASWYDFAVAIFEEAVSAGLLKTAPKVFPITTAEYPTPATRPSYSVLDTSETIRQLGSPPAHWRANLRQVIGELKDLG